MKYAINNWVYADEPLRDTFTRLAKYGYDGVELKGEPGLYSLAEIKSLCQEFDMQITSVLGWNIWGIPGRDLASPDFNERSAAIQYGQDGIDFASAVGAPIMIVLPSPAGRTAPHGNPETEVEWLAAHKTEWSNAVNSVRQMAAYAKSRGVVLAVEPINRYETYLLTTVDEALRFVDDVGVDNVKLNVDTFHMNIDEADLAAAIRKVGDRLVHMHAADSNRQAPGRGHTDFNAIFKALYEVGFNGTVVLEPVPPGADPGMAIIRSDFLPLRDIYAQESISYLKQIEESLKDS
jgi:D-psicose/D-tagatose/L-ribulose 3-epimerase